MKQRLVPLMALMLGLLLVGCTSGVSGGGAPGAGSASQPASTARQPFSGDVTGSIDGQVYTNEFAELTFTAPGDWAYLDQPVMDMNAAGGGALVTVSVESDFGVGVEEHLEMVSSGLIETQAAYEYERVDGFGRATIRGNAYVVLEMNAKPFGAEQKQYYLSRAREGYIIDIVITCPGSDDYESILACFS